MNKYSPTNIDAQISEWNEALWKMKRIHELQDEINRVTMNPLGKHYALNKYNFEVWFSLLNQLYHEGHADYAAKEVAEVENIKLIIENLMKYFPVYSSVINRGYDGSKRQDILNNKNWETLKKFLELYELKIKFFNNAHGLSTKKKEDMNRSILR